jgi:hypothetical protein
MTRSIENKMAVGLGALALLVLAARAMQLLLASAVLATKKPAKSRAADPGA